MHLLKRRLLQRQRVQLVVEAADVARDRRGCSSLSPVASHLLGPRHKFISDGVNSLAASCPRSIIECNGSRGIPDNKSDEYLGLLWLAKQGLNVQKILRDAEKYSNGSSSLALSTIEF